MNGSHESSPYVGAIVGIGWVAAQECIRAPSIFESRVRRRINYVVGIKHHFHDCGEPNASLLPNCAIQ